MQIHAYVVRGMEGGGRGGWGEVGVGGGEVGVQVEQSGHVALGRQAE